MTSRKQSLPDTTSLTHMTAGTDTHTFELDKITGQKRGSGGHKAPTLTKKLFTTNTCYEK